MEQAGFCRYKCRFMTMKSNKEINETHQRLIDEIENEGAVLMHINKEGLLTLVVTDDLSEEQIKVTERMLAAASPTIVLRAVLFIEVMLIKLEEYFDKMLSKIF